MDASERIRGRKVIFHGAIYSNGYIPFNFDGSLSDVH